MIRIHLRPLIFALAISLGAGSCGPASGGGGSGKAATDSGSPADASEPGDATQPHGEDAPDSAGTADTAPGDDTDAATPPAGSCAGKCGASFDPSLPCQCSDGCAATGKCCPDWKLVCEPALHSCKGKCGDPFDAGLPCQCNHACAEHGNCCADWSTECEPALLTCAGRCNEEYSPSLPCGCNTKCAKHGTCCADYLAVCSAGQDLEWVKAGGICDSQGSWHVVTFVSDGDTFSIDTGDKVRLVAVDSPEVTEEECYSSQATSHTLKTLKGKSVCLVPDPSQPDTDEYGRLLRNVFYDDPAVAEPVLFDARIVRLGFARVHYKFIWGTAHEEITILMEQKAKQESKGGWKECGWL